MVAQRQTGKGPDRAKRGKAPIAPNGAYNWEHESRKVRREVPMQSAQPERSDHCGDRIQVSGNLVDVEGRQIFPARVTIDQGRIADIRPLAEQQPNYLLPGFVDAHVHIESSMLTPHEFARAVVIHGTVAVVSDPHEIANVMGIQGVHYMLDDARRCPLKICFGVPSCVPATEFETAGGRLDCEQVEQLLDDPRLGHLGEMMNVPGVLAGDPDVSRKIRAAVARRKPVDGHAPGLRGRHAKEYFSGGISTDHECTCLEEAREKIQCGAKILIREGSAARNFEALHPLLSEQASRCMLCSDDLHPDTLVVGHINRLVARAIQRGTDLLDVLTAACLTPVRHYGMNVGQLHVGDDADFIVVDNLQTMGVRETYIRGELVAKNGQTRIQRRTPTVINRFQCNCPTPADLRVPATGSSIQVIQAIDGNLITQRQVRDARIASDCVVSDTDQDILKLVVVNRYSQAPPAIAFVTGFELKQGAIASSVAHDCHNIIAVGANDDDLCKALGLIVQEKGGLSLASGDDGKVLPLPVAGLMSTASYDEVARDYLLLDQMAKDNGVCLSAPFMTLSFLALLVIPEIKLSDKGLFDVNRFEFTPLVSEQG